MDPCGLCQLMALMALLFQTVDVQNCFPVQPTCVPGIGAVGQTWPHAPYEPWCQTSLCLACRDHPHPLGGLDIGPRLFEGTILCVGLKGNQAETTILLFHPEKDRPMGRIPEKA